MLDRLIDLLRPRDNGTTGVRADESDKSPINVPNGPAPSAAEPRTTEAASQREQLPSPAQAEARVEEVATATASVPAEPVDVATARRREKLAALAEIDALSIREKLKRFT